MNEKDGQNIGHIPTGKQHRRKDKTRFAASEIDLKRANSTSTILSKPLTNTSVIHNSVSGKSRNTNVINSGNSNTSKNRINQNRHKQRPKRRTLGDIMAAEYDLPDIGGVVAKSNNPREVILSLSTNDALKILEALRSGNGNSVLEEYLRSKISWTESYNKKLTR
jgi:hypothetical protein